MNGGFIPGGSKKFYFFFKNVQDNPSSYSMGAKGSFFWDKAAGTRR
jgi:hypothetical protein